MIRGFYNQRGLVKVRYDRYALCFIMKRSKFVITEDMAALNQMQYVKR